MALGCEKKQTETGSWGKKSQKPLEGVFPCGKKKGKKNESNGGGKNPPEGGSVKGKKLKSMFL